jgi:response regulator RpfG family c-di-GMP phosphodiesterase
MAEDGLTAAQEVRSCDVTEKVGAREGGGRNSLAAARRRHDFFVMHLAQLERATIALQHHEKLDGSGCPNRLTADEILPESNVLAVADMFEAMTAHRPYRPAIPVDTVLGLLEADAGIKLDSEAVRICVLLSRQGRLDRANT